MVFKVYTFPLGLVLLSLSACSVFSSSADFERVEPRYHRVVAGDTLWGLGKRYGVSAREIARLNRIDNPRSLTVGKTILVGFFPSKLSRARMHSRPGKTITSAKSRPAPRKTSGGRARIGWPVRTGRFMSGFGPRRGSFHDGIDIASPRGTPVYAAHSGKVIYAGNGLSGYGNLVIIDGDDRLTTIYAHNHRMFVRAGQRVRRGAQIAQVGATGRASGPHLHFEVRTRDRRGRAVAVDPMPLLMESLRRKPRYRVNESLSNLF